MVVTLAVVLFVSACGVPSEPDARPGLRPNEVLTGVHEALAGGEVDLAELSDGSAVVWLWTPL